MRSPPVPLSVIVEGEMYFQNTAHIAHVFEEMPATLVRLHGSNLQSYRFTGSCNGRQMRYPSQHATPNPRAAVLSRKLPKQHLLRKFHTNFQKISHWFGSEWQWRTLKRKSGAKFGIWMDLRGTCKFKPPSHWSSLDFCKLPSLELHRHSGWPILVAPAVMPRKPRSGIRVNGNEWFTSSILFTMAKDWYPFLSLFNSPGGYHDFSILGWGVPSEPSLSIAVECQGIDYGTRNREIHFYK